MKSVKRLSAALVASVLLVFAAYSPVTAQNSSSPTTSPSSQSAPPAPRAPEASRNDTPITIPESINNPNENIPAGKGTLVPEPEVSPEEAANPNASTVPWVAIIVVVVVGTLLFLLFQVRRSKG